MPPKVTGEYTPFTTVRPDQIEGPAVRPIHENFPEVHMTTAVGEAMASVGRLGYGALSDANKSAAVAFGNLGKEIEGAGDKLFNRAMGLQELENETQTKKASIEYDRYMTEKRLDYDQKVGEAADRGTLKAFMDDAEKQRQKLRATLPQTSKRDFDNHSMATMGRDSIHAATHTSQQIKNVAVGTAEAKVTMTIDNFGKTGDVNDAPRVIEEIRKEIYDTLAPAKGLTQEQADVEFRDKIGRMVGAKATSMSDTDPTTALKFLEANKEFMNDKAYEQARNTVWNAQEKRDSRNIADRVQSKNPDGPLEEKREEGKKLAKELNPDNPDLVKTTDDAIVNAHTKHRREQKEEMDRQFDIAKDAAWGYTAPGGKKPTSYEELIVDPKVKAAYDALGPDEKHRIDEILKVNGKEDYPPTAESNRRFQQLMGMAKPPAGEEQLQADFLATDLWQEKIPARQRDQLFALQRALRAKPLSQNPQVTAGMRTMYPYLPPNLQVTGPARSVFMGAYYTAMQEAQEAKGKVPLTKDEMKDIGYNILQDVTEKEGIRAHLPGWLGGTRPLYEKMRETPPFQYREEAKRMYPGITAEKIADKWAKEVLLQHLEELQKSTKPAVSGGKPLPPKVPISQ